MAREHFLLPEDERVRREDVPERMAVSVLLLFLEGGEIGSVVGFERVFVCGWGLGLCGGRIG